MKSKVSILILTFNAPKYVKETLESLSITTQIPEIFEYEVIVLDNASNSETKELLIQMKAHGYIDKLKFSNENTLFSKGNNLASQLCSVDSNFILLLNSDVQIRKPFWLRKLMDEKNNGGYAAASFGYCANPDRADGYCFLIDRFLYDKYQLDENYAWYWGITKLQAELIKNGKKILVIKNPDKLLYHYGGKSGKVLPNAVGMNISLNEILSWFNQNSKNIIIKDMAPWLSICLNVRVFVSNQIRRILPIKKQLS